MDTNSSGQGSPMVTPDVVTTTSEQEAIGQEANANVMDTTGQDANTTSEAHDDGQEEVRQERKDGNEEEEDTTAAAAQSVRHMGDDSKWYLYHLMRIVMI